MPFILNSKRRNSSNCFIIFYNVSVTFAIDFLLSPDRFRGSVPFSRVADLSWCHRKQDANAVLPACFVSGFFLPSERKNHIAAGWGELSALCNTLLKKKKRQKKIKPLNIFTQNLQKLSMHACVCLCVCARACLQPGRPHTSVVLITWASECAVSPVSPRPSPPALPDISYCPEGRRWCGRQRRRRGVTTHIICLRAAATASLRALAFGFGDQTFPWARLMRRSVMKEAYKSRPVQSLKGHGKLGGVGEGCRWWSVWWGGCSTTSTLVFVYFFFSRKNIIFDLLRLHIDCLVMNLNPSQPSAHGWEGENTTKSSHLGKLRINSAP